MDPIGASNTWRWFGYENSWIVLDGSPVQSVSGGGHWGGGMFHAGPRQMEGPPAHFQSMGRLGAHADAGGATYGFMNWFEKGEPGRPAPKAEAFFVNEKDRTWVDSKLTPQPTGPALQPIKLTGARDKVAKKTYIRAARYPQPTFDTALAECKADSSWRTFENTASGHDVMVDAPEWLTGILLQVSYRSYEARTVALHRRGAPTARRRPRSLATAPAIAGAWAPIEAGPSP